MTIARRTVTIDQLSESAANQHQPITVTPRADLPRTVRFGNQDRGMPWAPAPRHDYLSAPLPPPSPDPEALRSIQTRKGDRPR